MRELTDEEKADDYYMDQRDYADQNDDEELSECCGATILDCGLCSDCKENL